jgi:hypothetical protein
MSRFVNVRVSGRVLDFTTNAGVAGAAVAFGNVGTITNAAGSYTVIVPTIGGYEPVVDGRWMGVVRVTAPASRGDLLVRAGTCVARYGVVTDAETMKPVPDAVVTILGPGLNASSLTASDGWYRIDLGCPRTVSSASTQQ